MSQKLLVATTNENKLREISSFLADAHVELVSLGDLGTNIPSPEETGDSIEANALLKARYYAEHSGLMTLADDSGLFIDALDGWPGVGSARIGKTSEERRAEVLQKLTDVPNEKRTASFRIAMVLFDPQRNAAFTAFAEDPGTILEEEVEDAVHDFCYDPIFHSTSQDKAFAHMSVAEKNAISHRGKALSRIQYHLQDTYEAKQVIAPLACILNEKGQLFMNLRNDPHNPEFHKKWEFPGGGVDFGESVLDNLKRETLEETGYEIEPLSSLDYITSSTRVKPTYRFQVFLIPYVCRIVKKVSDPNKEEAIESKWFDFDDVKNHELIGDNAAIFNDIRPKLESALQNPAFNFSQN